MKNYLIGTSLLLGSFVAPSFADESKDIYLSIGGGLLFPSDIKGDQTIDGTRIDAEFPTDDPFNYSIGLGKEFNDLRFELNYSGSTVSSDSITATSGGVGITASITPYLKAKTKSYMLYGFKNLSNETKYTPYIGLGLGMSTLKTDETTVTLLGESVALTGSSNTVFTYALKGGVNYKIAKDTSIYTEATYQNFGSFTAEEEGYENVNYDSINYFGINAGLKFNF